jgi:hypothetical protein
LAKKRSEKGGRRTYECENPPCIHVVIDDHRKMFKVFVEHEYGDDEIMAISIPVGKLENACRLLEEAKSLGYREANNDYEIDYLARKYLNVRPVDEEY